MNKLLTKASLVLLGSGIFLGTQTANAQQKKGKFSFLLPDAGKVKPVIPPEKSLATQVSYKELGNIKSHDDHSYNAAVKYVEETEEKILEELPEFLGKEYEIMQNCGLLTTVSLSGSGNEPARLEIISSKNAKVQTRDEDPESQSATITRIYIDQDLDGKIESTEEVTRISQIFAGEAGKLIDIALVEHNKLGDVSTSLVVLDIDKNYESNNASNAASEINLEAKDNQPGNQLLLRKDLRNIFAQAAISIGTKFDFVKHFSQRMDLK